MDSLSQKVEIIRSSAAGFYAIDLHLHSPCSYDWDNSGTRDGERDPMLDRIPPDKEVSEQTIDTYCSAVCISGRNLIAITDHNRFCFSEAAAGKYKGKIPCVLPGIELSVAFSQAPLIRDLRVHVLAVFPEDTHNDAIARILPAGTDPENNRDPRAIFSYNSVEELIALIHKEDGIAIAAHIEAKNGLRGVYKNTAELLLEPIGGTDEAQEVLKALGDQVKDELVKFDAIQVKPKTEAVHYRGPHGNLRVPLIVASDCHSGNGLSAQHPDKYTYVKMAKPSFNSLQDALKFPDLRIRFITGLPRAVPPRLLGLRIVGHKRSENTFFDDTVLGFSDNLTCIIGPRGSGKSAMIDGLRYLMGYNRALDQIDKVSSQVIDRQKHTLQKSRIEALYQAVDERIYRLSATYDPHESYVTNVYDIEGNRLNIDDVETTGEFPLNLFGWGELELLAESAKTQRELLDRFIPEISNLKQEKREIILSLDDNKDKCITMAQAMGHYFTDPELSFIRVDEYKGQYDELNTPEIEDVFSELDSIKAKRKILEILRQKLEQRLGKGDVCPALELSSILEDEDLGEWTKEFNSKLKIQDLDIWFIEINRTHEGKLKAALDIVKGEDEKLGRLEESSEKEIQKVIGEDIAITGDLRNSAKQRYDKAVTNKSEYEKLHTKFKELIDDRNSLLDALKDCDKRIFATRHQETQRISDEISLVKDENYQINLVLTQQADKTSFLEALTKCNLKFHGNYKVGRHHEVLTHSLAPRELADIIMGGEIEMLDGLTTSINGTDFTLGTSHAQHLVHDNSPFTAIEGLDTIRIDPLKLDNILKIQQMPVDDEFIITLGDKPIQYCSPGQRCSAMLPVVTLTSQAPIIIDQPEDNLDNRLVSKALFKILSRLKETRQVILATHNPNILVSGDAEQVLLLNPIGDLELSGCIDEPKIIDAILGLMEGGPEAFNRRKTKYKPFLDV